MINIFNLNKKIDMSAVKIYGFIGVVGSGKGYNCEKLKEQGFIQIDFADCLRNMAWKMLDWQPQNTREYDDFKKGLIKIPNYGKIDGRAMLQKLGSMMRELDKDFWVKAWKKSVDRAVSMGYKNICVSDVRYENEIEALKSLGWKSVVKIQFCDYHSDRYRNDLNHESEFLAQKLLKEGYKDGDLIYGK